MKVGFRTPNIEKSVKARTTGRVKRAANGAVNPLYGKRGVGFIKDPGKSVKDAVYKRVTFGVSDIAKIVGRMFRNRDGKASCMGLIIGACRLFTGITCAAITPFLPFAGGPHGAINDIFAAMVCGCCAIWLLSPMLDQSRD